MSEPHFMTDGDEQYVININSGNDTSNGCLKIGDTFSSFAELERKVNKLQNDTYSIFYKRNCLSKAEGLKKKRKKILKDGIEYHNLKLCCKKDGHNKRPNGDRESWTFKTNCPAFIMISANNEGDALFVKNMNLNHNHECTKALFECYPENRRLTFETDEMAKEIF